MKHIKNKEEKRFDVIKKVEKIRKGFFAEFGGFIRKYGVITLAIGFVIGNAVTQYVQAIVRDLVTPAVGYLINNDNLSKLMWGNILIGDFLSKTIEFLILLIIIFISVRYVLKVLKLVDDDTENGKKRKNVSKKKKANLEKKKTN